MREITRSVKVALKCRIAVVLVDVDLPYWTSKVEHVVAFTAIFSNICTAHAQKRLFMNVRWKFKHHRSIPRPRFSITVLNFGDLATFPVAFCILYAECPPYFYFRFVWPTDLESISHALTPTSIKFPPSLKLLWLYTAKLYRFCLLLRHVTLWPWSLNVWPWTVAVYGGSRDQPCEQVRKPRAYPFLIYEV